MSYASIKPDHITENEMAGSTTGQTYISGTFNHS